MTLTEVAAAMRRLADAIDAEIAKSGDASDGKDKPMLDGDAAVGAAVMITYLRDLVAEGDRDVYDRPSLLVILESISRDGEIFPCGVGRMIWDAE